MDNKKGEKQYKKMSNKEIFRILAFEFRQSDSIGIKISLISEMVSNLFYPNDVTGEAKKAFKDLIEKAFKSHTVNNKEEITEQQFCSAMDSIEKYMNEETNDRFLQKIFRRHSKQDKNYLNKEEFRVLMQNYKDENINEKDIQEIYERMSNGDKNGISYENFKKFSI
ncbi:hypothetical protein TTHERM_00569460 (macronuclear) [Tetrahymena thermophila SB210]|uniref:EF-hand domain-containing protein n=1 Tax=Tetrahymena thermophila (strain SB210) TaxID=312017 RepID=Q24I30_TETTS|nr:hypothetical protein TTHERM_00569460 [Tetrahymena thermophila SB210]EAS07408.2 hypothetical protein TTHERM_00569460 [Tetrahymena thermophila SB210]|eukprot:XP_001027650.2 hypothetical protein TTHERM_00569460 [Tetrahymena thermophila SB210]